MKKQHTAESKNRHIQKKLSINIMSNVDLSKHSTKTLRRLATLFSSVHAQPHNLHL